jgi:hypothetical protein
LVFQFLFHAHSLRSARKRERQFLMIKPQLGRLDTSLNQYLFEISQGFEVHSQERVLQESSVSYISDERYPQMNNISSRNTL